MIASTKRTARCQKEKIRAVILSPNEIASRAETRCNIERNDLTFGPGPFASGAGGRQIQAARLRLYL